LLKSTHPAGRLNWTLESSNLLGTVLLYVDFTAPVEAIRNKLVEIVKGSNLWDGNVVKLQVTDAKEGAMELRALVSACSAAAFELRCDVREKLIEFLRTEYPTALPHARAETVASQRLGKSESRRSRSSARPAVERHAEQCQHWRVGNGSFAVAHALIGHAWANALSRRAAGEVHILRIRPSYGSPSRRIEKRGVCDSRWPGPLRAQIRANGGKSTCGAQVRAERSWHPACRRDHRHRLGRKAAAGVAAIISRLTGIA